MRDLWAAGGVYLLTAGIAPPLVGMSSSLTTALLTIVLACLVMAALAGRLARAAAGAAGSRSTAVAAGLCLATLLAVVVGTLLLTRAHNGAAQAALVAPMAVGVLVLGPAVLVAQWTARSSNA